MSEFQDCHPGRSVSIPNNLYPLIPRQVFETNDTRDQLTQEAQGALRRGLPSIRAQKSACADLRVVMEIYSTTTRFALCCNYVSRIIDPIASRTTKFRFKAIGGEQAFLRIAEILSECSKPTSIPWVSSTSVCPDSGLGG